MDKQKVKSYLFYSAFFFFFFFFEIYIFNFFWKYMILL